MTTKILINDIDKIKNFVNIMSKCPFDAKLISGRYIVDAKSLMGIFSLNTSKPIDLEICDDSNINQNVLNLFNEYIVA